MAMSRLIAAFGLSCMVVLPASVAAQPVQTTIYSYYTVTGNSSAEVYNAMLRSGPRVGGSDAYAATTASTSQDGKLVQGQSCQVQNYRLKMNFTIRLPKLAAGARLAPAEHSRWQQFAQFVQRHEETHRSIWLGCAQALENQVKALHAESCAEASRKAAELWDVMRKTCARKHDAFDTAQQMLLIRQPFVRFALIRRSTVTNAAAAQ